MSNALAKVEAGQVTAWSPEQTDLIKRTCAPGATNDELQMYLHVAKTSGLDPLRRQLHFVKHGGRVHFIADVNGLQARAAAEPDFEGILHAVVYEKDVFEVDQARGEVSKHVHNPFGTNGRIAGAWAVVRRRGMLPFLAMVRFSEYDNASNPLWKSKPAVMIAKVAKSTALRLAYPAQLSSIYERAEMDQALPAPESEPAPEPRREKPAPASVTVSIAQPETADEILQAIPIHTVKAAQEAVDKVLGRAPAKMGFGPRRGDALGELAFDDLLAAREEAMERLSASTSGDKWAVPLKKNLAEISAELAARETASAGESGVAG